MSRDMIDQFRDPPKGTRFAGEDPADGTPQGSTQLTMSKSGYPPVSSVPADRC
jgi:hypothetical protein